MPSLLFFNELLDQTQANEMMTRVEHPSVLYNSPGQSCIKYIPEVPDDDIRHQNSVCNKIDKILTTCNIIHKDDYHRIH